MNENLSEFAKSGVIPQQISETGAEDEPLTEALICDTISGGARYINNMPEELTLLRRLSDGSEYRATYIQTNQAQL